MFPTGSSALLWMLKVYVDAKANEDIPRRKICPGTLNTKIPHLPLWCPCSSCKLVQQIRVHHCVFAHLLHHTPGNVIAMPLRPGAF